MSFANAYAAKLTTPETAVASIASGEKLCMAMAIGEPPALLKAVADRAEAGEIADLRLYYFESKPHAAQTVLRYELLDRIRPHCMFLTGIERELMRRGREEGRRVIEFIPTAFSRSPRLLADLGMDTLVTAVSPMDRHGYFTFGTNNDYVSRVARVARRVVVEVNPNMPRVMGESLLHVSEVDAIVEHEAPLLEARVRTPSATDEAIAAIVAGMIPDGACLQMGIGGLPDAVARALRGHSDLGVHTELLTPGLVELMRSGAVTNRKKATFPGRSVFTFAMGDRALYDFIDDNPGISSHPVDVVNDPRHIAKNDRVVSVNATLQVDLTGACNSEHISGAQYSGAGGQLDFVRGAAASRGGLSFICCPSTAGEGKVSRITARLDGPVTTPRNDVHFVVTEHGVAELRGRSTAERAMALIGVAHPDFRSALTEAARRDGLI
ncbi:acetyl-CoA hydrolase/transferase C-terminal domain-containing protein [Brevundimonas sp. 2R-24]|uniref:Acetyl-CoA hydrolase/transferase C-terminal domain-containing protein n=1 Tax=Peiella sedimenti TaxID=3061083 RepID=A0ABT8SLU1_9CAUL|nr:acetyl-CoA hydrolase/transferase C-terminal domain-containing protein [Caulobacteraceae bacterium XZ-24]